jgi:hypothetical protein
VRGNGAAAFVAASWRATVVAYKKTPSAAKGDGKQPL